MEAALIRAQCKTSKIKTSRARGARRHQNLNAQKMIEHRGGLSHQSSERF
jgi:hypothetical protein